VKSFDKKIFGTLFFSIFAAVTGVGIVVPLLPVYAHDLGASGLYIGFIFGAFSLSRTFFLPYFGRLSDRKGRKPLIVAGLFCYALISIAFILSKNVETLIFIRFVQGIASSMMMPVIQAYVGDITPQGREGLTMGVFNMSMFFGLSIGPLLGGVINDHFSLQISFVCMGVLAFIGFGLSLVFLPPRKLERIFRRKRPPATWRHLIRDRVIAGLFMFRFAYTACIGVIWSFLPVFADSAFALSSSAIGVLIMLGVFISGIIHTPMGYLADRINKLLMVTIGGLVVGYAILSFEWSTGFGDLFLASVLFGLGGGIAMPAHMAIAVVKGDRTAAMGSVMALMTVAHSLGMLVGSLLGGVMMDLYQLRLAFTSGAAIMVVGVTLFLVCAYPAKNDQYAVVEQELE
jgi:multidrug resistance protein